MTKPSSASAFDKITHKFMFADSLRSWLFYHRGEVQKYLDTKVRKEDHENRFIFFYDFPNIAKAIVENDKLNRQKKIDHLLNLFTSKSNIAVIIGIRGSGKTAFMVWLSEELRELGMRVEWLESLMPEDFPFPQIQSFGDAGENTIIFCDEASLTYNARRAMARESVQMSQRLATLRHRGNSIVFCSQHSALLDVNITRMADILIFKKLSFEEMQESTSENKYLLQYIKHMQPLLPKEILFTDGEIWNLFSFPLPSYWSEMISKPYRKLSYEEGVDEAMKLLTGGMSEKTVLSKMQIKMGWDELPVEVYRGFYKKKKKMRK